MDREYAVRAIAEGMERYFRLFAMADTVTYHDGDIAWIAPAAGAAGPAIVYHVALNASTAEARIDALLPELEAGSVPGFWVLTPTATPSNLRDLLVAKGFRDLSAGSNPEPGMALDLTAQVVRPAPNPTVTVAQVRSHDAFAVWVDVVNEALHGWDLLDAQNYAAWLDCEDYDFYLASLAGVPVATVATIRDGESASLEFVGTLAAYRRRGAAMAACVTALQTLQSQGVKIVTLRSSFDAIPLYEKLGFVPYYDQLLLSYEGARAGDLPVEREAGCD